MSYLTDDKHFHYSITSYILEAFIVIEKISSITTYSKPHYRACNAFFVLLVFYTAMDCIPIRHENLGILFKVPQALYKDISCMVVWLFNVRTKRISQLLSLVCTSFSTSWTKFIRFWDPKFFLHEKKNSTRNLMNSMTATLHLLGNHYLLKYKRNTV